MNDNQKRLGFTTRLILLLTILMFIGNVFLPKTAHAHDMYFVQTTLDTTSYKYTAMARMDKTGMTGLESGHIAHDYDFKDLLEDNLPTVSGTDYELAENDAAGDPKFTFGFPFQEQGETWGGKDKNHATKADADQAQYIASTIPTQLNDFIDVVYSGKRPKDMDEHVARMATVTSAIKTVAGGGSATINDFTITRGKLKPYKGGYDKTYGVQNTDWLTVTKGDYKQDFIYQVPKGYIKVGDWKNTHLERDYDYAEDAKYISWNMMIYQAHYFYFAAGVSTSNTYAIGEPGYLEQKVVELLESLLNGLIGILGLYSMEELIFNEGVRESSAWHYGIFPKSYDDMLNKFHMIFQAIAWSLLIAAMYKILIQRNLSVVNPMMRVSLMNGIMDLFITAFLLILIYPLINFMMLINFRIVDIFAAMGLDLDNLAGLNSYNGLISGIIMQFFYFFIEIWLNFVYIVRSIVLAILVASSPLFVAAIAFGTKWKQLFGTFMKELTANIFLQSFQAFVITFILLTSSQSRGIELAIILFSLVVLTEFFRGLVFGNAGGIAGSIGMSAVKSGAGFAGSAYKSTQKSSKGKNNNDSSSKEEGKESGKEESSSSDSLEVGGFGSNKIKNPMARAAANFGIEAANTGAHVAKAGLVAGGSAGYALAFGAMDDSFAKAGGGMAVAGAKSVGGAAKGLNAASNTLGREINNGFQDWRGGAVADPTLSGGMYHQDWGNGVTTTPPDNPPDDPPNNPPNDPPNPLPPNTPPNVGGTSNGGDDLGGMRMPNSPPPPPPPPPPNAGAAVVSRKPARVTGDGLAQDKIQLSREKMEGMGIQNMNTDNSGRLYTRYNADNMHPEHAEQLQMMHSAYSHGTAEDRQELKAMGVDKVAVDPNSGEYIVTYNDVGKEAMGITQARSTDNGFSQVVPADASPQVIIPVTNGNFSQEAVDYQQRRMNPQPAPDTGGNSLPLYRNGANQPAPFEQGGEIPMRPTVTQPQQASTPTQNSSSTPDVQPDWTPRRHRNGGNQPASQPVSPPTQNPSSTPDVQPDWTPPRTYPNGVNQPMPMEQGGEIPMRTTVTQPQQASTPPTQPKPTTPPPPPPPPPQFEVEEELDTRKPREEEREREYEYESL